MGAHGLALRQEGRARSQAPRCREPLQQPALRSQATVSRETSTASSTAPIRSSAFSPFAPTDLKGAANVFMMAVSTRSRQDSGHSVVRIPCATTSSKLSSNSRNAGGGPSVLCAVVSQQGRASNSRSHISRLVQASSTAIAACSPASRAVRTSLSGRASVEGVVSNKNCSSIDSHLGYFYE